MAKHNIARKLVIVAVIAQILVLGYMAGKREYIRATGERIYLRSAPIDPRDPFRGDYVRLRYNINTIHHQLYQGSANPAELPEASVLYAVLKRGPDNVFTLDYLTNEEPEGKTFIKGRSTRDWRFAPLRGDKYFNIKYGIEQYFVQQGKGREMEAKLGQRDTLQIPLEMEIALGHDGTAVIVGHRWSRLGIQLEFIRAAQARRNAVDPVSNPIVKITLQNVSDEALALPLPANDCGFHLVLENGNSYENPADRGCDQASAEQIEPVVLQPGESYDTELDFSRPRWHVKHENSWIEMGAINEWRQFRVVLNLNTVNESADNYRGIPLWLGELETPLFTGSGAMD